ncbi:hypothetical protein TWF225_005125 [Orbilia oligospora]|uniref:Uncharacterized protein n=1 Tax=Orbilia oligospora TaxID=2813651 RepID=A0A7C8U7J4_ORBOL|nr:hypothetical protein TWF751_004162 [Orbilia oligospora]KAF3185743.1 hypothetical protein TWF225_005125 [Orbilia oligospora]KAF3241514.1 hypothetical protein TWF128_011002 [Orbilia oligospora]KAF3249329.1 hypothetical protein TWF217_008926 [Orbilia oligospora]KAF3296405.1 hypothetical protein TWF132_010999 [Orbilia oligospora]
MQPCHCDIEILAIRPQQDGKRDLARLISATRRKHMQGIGTAHSLPPGVNSENFCPCNFIQTEHRALAPPR